MSTKFAKKFEKFSNAENYYQNRRKSTLFRAFSPASGGMKNCRPSGNSVGRQKFFYFFAEMLRKHLMHSAKSRPSLRMERALRSGRWDSICCGKQPLNILEVVGLRAPTAVETCHWHVSKSRLSNPTFGAKKQQPSEWMAVVLAEKVGFEPTWRVTANSISSRARYDHFDTSPYRACLTGAYLFYHAMAENTSAFSEIVIIFISPGRHPADNGLPHSGKA